MTLDKNYQFKEYEKKWWNYWEKGNWFHADENSQKEPFCILIPPPNVTDRLHMGHGLVNTLQDILIRWHRMKGFNACWLPGTDHAGIATQMMVEKSLQKSGTSREKLGREKFFEKCVEWKEENGEIIIDQLKQLGASCDWERLAYTMDPSLSKAVRHIFVKLFEEGLIYRGERLVNWDPVLKTAVSDDEVINEERTDFLWFIHYPVVDSSEVLIVATTRPETMFGDTAVAVHPEDERYLHLIGKKVKIPLSEREIFIIADTHVKKDFGTGCLKVTPAHDPNDFVIGQRHNLDSINILNDDATLNESCPIAYIGKDRFEVRKIIEADLKKIGLFEKKETIKHSVPLSDRTKTVIEPRLSKQWFVKMKDLAEPALQCVKDGRVNFHPDNWKKTYYYWLENIQDWCISRQLWWGHRIPIWYCQKCQATLTGLEDPTQCSSCGSSELVQDPDVLDTWFSSWLWPLSPWGWPEETKNLQAFFPSHALVTGPDIIYLWVARMIMVSLYVKGEVPFRDVYFNAIICDKQGRKFSKTLGNGIDPLEVISKYGADSVRFTIVSLAPLGGRVKLDVNDFETGHKFINKLWNASRFILSQLEEDKISDFQEESLPLYAKWVLHEFHETTELVNQHLEKFQFNEAVQKVYHFAWHIFCDWGLELAKINNKESLKEKNQFLSVLIFTLDGLMRLASPFIPFVSEEIWQNIPHHPRWDRPVSLVIAEYPRSSEIPRFSEEALQWNVLREMISGIRSARTRLTIPPKVKIDSYIEINQEVLASALQYSLLIKNLAMLENLQMKPLGEKESTSKNCVVALGAGWNAYLYVGDLVDLKKEKERLESELKRVSAIVDGLQKKISNESFMARAPQDIVDQTKEQWQNMSTQLDFLNKSLANLRVS